MTAHAQTELLADRYRLEERIASGSTCEAWRATDLALGRTVAVKVLRQDAAGDAEALNGLRAEAQIAGSLRHANIAQVYDYDEMGGQWPPYLVMEYVDGPSLAQVIAGGPMDLTTALGVLCEVAAGLAALHEAGQAHRDLRLGHVLLDGDGIVKLIGLGSRCGPAADGFGWDLRCLGELARQCLPQELPPGVTAFVRELRATGPDAKSDLAGLASRLAATLRAGAAPPEPGASAREAAELSTQPLPAIGRPSRGLGKVMAVGAAAAVVLTGVTIAGFGGHQRVAAEPKLAKVDVRRAQLIGRPAGPVVRLLRHLDLKVLVRRHRTASRPPGRVLDVRPSGWVAPGSAVVVIVSALPAARSNGRPSGVSRSPHPHRHRSDPAATPSASASPRPSATPTPSPSSSSAPSVSPSPTASPTTSAAASPSASPNLQLAGDISARD